MENQKKGKGKTILIVILIILLLGAVSYIAYDKMLDEKCMKTKEPEKTVKKDETANVMSEEEALKLGKEKYEYVREGLYICGYNQVKTDSNTKIEGVIDGLPKYKVTNISEIKANLTTHAFSDWYYYNDVEKQFDIYYMPTNCGNGGSLHAIDRYEIAVSSVSEDTIIYDIIEKSYKFINNEIIHEIDESANFKTKFVLIKDNSDIWKIDEYIDYGSKSIV